MTPRRKRLLAVVAILAGVGAATALAMLAFQDNLLYFYNPSQVLAGDAPSGRTFRIGGMVTEGSLKRTEGTLQVRFVVTDYQHSIPVSYEGLLPDLFREGQGVIAHGKLSASGEFVADEVLAKHDENYMPPEVAESLHTADAREGIRVIPELGHFSLILALLLSIAQAVFSLAGASRVNAAWMAAGRSAVVGQFVFVALAFGTLAWAFIQRDFSVLYVATNSHSELPLFYRVAAVWGAHEGSLLLWSLVLAGWTLAVAACSGSLEAPFRSRVLGFLGLISIGFQLFMLTTSNPFERLMPAASEGLDLNPLLQDFALAVHPPILYFGYVGFSVAFAFACATLLEGRLDAAWARWTRPWTLAAWLFLTIGIALGSWWAYYELGWGGWWFWDPVENASFMPWLAGTALIHSLAVTEKRGLFKSWTLLLAVSAFSLSLLGTFLVRSGVLISVHAFATDPARGVFILAFLTIVIGGALVLYAWRAPRLKSAAGFEATSRESFMLFNNALLVAALGLILLGTLYPLFMDALELGKISVGPPYFELVFLVPMLPLLALLGRRHARRLEARPAGLGQESTLCGGRPRYRRSTPDRRGGLRRCTPDDDARLCTRALGHAVVPRDPAGAHPCPAALACGGARHGRRAFRRGAHDARHHGRAVLQGRKGRCTWPSAKRRGSRATISSSPRCGMSRARISSASKRTWSCRARAVRSRSSIRRSASTTRAETR